MDRLRYPIGQFAAVQEVTEQQREDLIETVAEMPNQLRKAVDGLEPDQLNMSYRPDGWTVQQVVHHLADANMNGYFRFKRALTEEHPLAGTFRKDLFAELSELPGCTN